MASSFRGTEIGSSFGPGWFIFMGGRRYQVTDDDLGPLLVPVKCIETHEHEVISTRELFAAPEEGQPATIVAPTLEALNEEFENQHPLPQPAADADLPPNLLDRADWIIQVVETFELLVAVERGNALKKGESIGRTEALERVCARSEKELGKSVVSSTFYKYRARYQQHNGMRAAIAASMRRSTYHQSQKSAAQHHFEDTLIMEFYAGDRSVRPKRKTLIEETAPSILHRTGGLWIDPEKCGGSIPEDLVDELLNPRIPMSVILANPEKADLLSPVEVPSRAGFYEHMNWFVSQPDAGKHVIDSRYGKGTWEKVFMAFDTFVSRATAPGQYIFADHKLLNTFTVDEGTRSITYRLWLTVLIDAFSRAIVGIALLFEQPCIESIQTALKHAIWEKTSHLELGVEGEWVCYGMIGMLSLDNAWAHHSYSLEDICRGIAQKGKYTSIDLVFRAPYKGRQGALVERYLGIIGAELVKYLVGAFKKRDRDQIRDARREACLLYEDVNKFIHQRILKYMHTPHGELNGLTPHEKWCQGMQLRKPLVPVLTPEIERLFWRKSPTTRTITNKGICAFGLHYWSPELKRLPKKKRDGTLIKYSFRYDVDDISCLAVCLNGEVLCDVYAKELRLPDGTTMSLSLAELNMAKRMAKEMIKKRAEKLGDQADAAHLSDIHWLDYIADLEELFKLRQAEQRKARKGEGAAKSNGRLPIDVQAMEEALAQMPLDEQDMAATRSLLSFVEG